MTHLSDRQLAILRNRQGENIPVPPMRKKRDNVEHRYQESVIDWWSTVHAKFDVPERLLFAIPNGGWRDPIGAKNLKREGQRNGVSDLMLAVPRGIYHGAFIEMKAPGGVASDDQRAFFLEALAQGYACRFCYSVASAMDFVTGYLGGEEI